MVMKAIGYIRVSTDKQVDGVSLDAQRSKIKAWCDLNEVDLVQIYSDEGISGVKDDRDGLVSALDDVVEMRGVLVVYSLSRLSRSAKFTMEISEMLDRNGCDLVSVNEKIDTTTAAGKMVFRMMAVLNEFERDQISERVKSAMDYKRGLGEKLGGIVPYGWDDVDGKLVENEAEQSVILMIRNLNAENISYSGIAKWLNKREITTKTGSKWYPQTVKNVLNYNNNG